MKFLGLVFFVYLTVINLTNGDDMSKGCARDTLSVEIYYETMCPDSVKFIRNQLYPVIKANDWMGYVELRFVPYGRVSVERDPLNNVTNLSCEHGESECDLNALHACIIENNSEDEQLEMFNCLLKGADVDDCAKKFNIDVSAAKNCKNSRSNADILKEYGELTKAVNITSIPYVILGERIDPLRQDDILINFTDEFCRKYRKVHVLSPEQC